MRCKATIAITAAALAAACTPMQWVKQDATPQQLEQDSAYCQQQAWREAQYRSLWYYSPPAPLVVRDQFGRPALIWPYSPFGDPFHDRFMEESRLAHFCMRAKGWELAPVEPKKDAPPKQ